MVPQTRKRQREADAPTADGGLTAAPLAAASEADQGAGDRPQAQGEQHPEAQEANPPRRKLMKISTEADVSSHVQAPQQAPLQAAQQAAPSGGGDAAAPVAVPAPPPFPASHYALTLDQLRDSGYPLPELDPDGEMACPDGYVATLPTPGGASQCHAAAHGGKRSRHPIMCQPGTRPSQRKPAPQAQRSARVRLYNQNASLYLPLPLPFYPSSTQAASPSTSWLLSTVRW
jgi:hypothetical protein